MISTKVFKPFRCLQGPIIKNKKRLSEVKGGRVEEKAKGPGEKIRIQNRRKKRGTRGKMSSRQVVRSTEKILLKTLIRSECAAKVRCGYRRSASLSYFQAVRLERARDR